ncbi:MULTISPECIES: hypothetical protein [unclassified Marinobacterium]|uniref:hypothetical protein n=1 Tax=unclassified Marinobacterium TaxID=2644139 RepID=UPI0015696163|nr:MULTISPECIES: hypothetical protein [unclassified Marinobacterium]NRP53834.1 hypothetical protein [Marinobacterium sp. xm-v-242]NRP60644.1 hypothetical protein [Marinobacterium sp. xm-d-564]NRP84109.1 hypothetical protein [Marinobacterium sp. xm-d-509]
MPRYNHDHSQTVNDLQQARDLIEQRIFELKEQPKRKCSVICKLTLVSIVIAIVLKTKVT